MLQPLALLAMVVWAWPWEGPPNPPVPPSVGVVVDRGATLDGSPALSPSPDTTGWRRLDLWLIESESESSGEDVDPEGDPVLDLPWTFGSAVRPNTAGCRWRPVPRSGSGGCSAMLRC